MKKMSIDNPFFNVMGNIGDWMLLNVLFVLTSVPIITIGMSLTSMYKVALRRTRGESVYLAKEYFQACRQEWKQSTKLWVIFFLTGMLLLFDVLYGQNLKFYLNVAIGVLVVFWGFSFSYAFPLQARFENTVGNTLKNTLYLALHNLPYTVLFMLLNAIPVICIIAGSFWTMMIMPIYLVLGFSLTAKINSIFLERIFKAFMGKELEE